MRRKQVKAHSSHPSSIIHHPSSCLTPSDQNRCTMMLPRPPRAPSSQRRRLDAKRVGGWWHLTLERVGRRMADGRCGSARALGVKTSKACILQLQFSFFNHRVGVRDSFFDTLFFFPSRVQFIPPRHHRSFSLTSSDTALRLSPPSTLHPPRLALTIWIR
jgi:hypothetical protein